MGRTDDSGWILLNQHPNNNICPGSFYEWIKNLNGSVAQHITMYPLRL